MYIYVCVNYLLKEIAPSLYHPLPGPHAGLHHSVPAEECNPLHDLRHQGGCSVVVGGRGRLCTL
jgi:hypothetical protein